MEELATLKLQNNSLMGSLPGEWGWLRCLADLRMDLNKLSGTLPAQWSGMDNLNTLYLSNNSLVGSLPSEWGRLKRLTTLDISHNRLSSSLPPHWEGMEVLVVLSLEGNRLVGALPSEWGQLRKLRRLSLRSNRLTGTLPAEWRGMELLKFLFISENNVHGTVPWKELASNLVYFEAASNCLTGSLPSDIRLPSWTILSDNQLSGSLPGNISGAQLLDLSRNLLSGALPDPLTAPHLVALYIEGNPGLQKPVPDCWLYHRACLPNLLLFHDGGLLRESASSYSWRRRNCRDELAFQWGDLSNVNIHSPWALLLYKDRTNGQHTDIKKLCSNQNVPEVLGGLWGSFAALVLAGYALRRWSSPGSVARMDWGHVAGLNSAQLCRVRIGHGFARFAAGHVRGHPPSPGPLLGKAHRMDCRVLSF
eukprot:jgi/Botrbrau1/19615/Bobra.0637s0003.1